MGAFMPFGSDDMVHEGFANPELPPEDAEPDSEDIEQDTEEDFEDKEDSDEKEDFKVSTAEEEEEEVEEGFESGPANKKKKSKKVAPPPDNGSRAEALELGKKYNMPSEGDDEDYHLDAGTTFLNAYKSLKPDQISAMTKDTQELIATQKQLMSTLSTLKPLITDGKQMMDTFQNYFGGEGMGDLGKMAEKFIGK